MLPGSTSPVYTHMIPGPTSLVHTLTLVGPTSPVYIHIVPGPTSLVYIHICCYLRTSYEQFFKINISKVTSLYIGN